MPCSRSVLTLPIAQCGNNFRIQILAEPLVRGILWLLVTLELKGQSFPEDLFFSPCPWRATVNFMNTWDSSVNFKLYLHLSSSHMQSTVLWKEENEPCIEFWTEGKAALLNKSILLQRVLKSLCQPVISIKV